MIVGVFVAMVTVVAMVTGVFLVTDVSVVLTVGISVYHTKTNRFKAVRHNALHNGWVGGSVTEYGRWP